jgi:hypothetical protein
VPLLGVRSVSSETPPARARMMTHTEQSTAGRKTGEQGVSLLYRMQVLCCRDGPPEKLVAVPVWGDPIAHFAYYGYYKGHEHTKRRLVIQHHSTARRGETQFCCTDADFRVIEAGQ